MADVLDRIPELQDVLSGMLAFLMELHDDDNLTVDDLGERIPEVPGAPGRCRRLPALPGKRRLPGSRAGGLGT